MVTLLEVEIRLPASISQVIIRNKTNLVLFDLNSVITITVQGRCNVFFTVLLGNFVA